MRPTLIVHEIYVSVQGESTHAGLPCVFVRLTGCNLRCSYCDTAYAFRGGQKLELDAVLDQVRQLARPFRPRHPGLPLIELTGGEPLLQTASLELMRRLCDEKFTVLVETSGALDIAGVDPRVHRIMDLKCPSSGEVARNRWENLSVLRATDEIKFVIATMEDYAWMRRMLEEHHLERLCPLLVSWAAPLTPEQQDPSLKSVPAGSTPITRRQLVERLIADALPARFQLQLHKVIWPPDQRGV